MQEHSTEGNGLAGVRAVVGGTGDRPPPVAVVVSRYNASVTDRLLEGALAEFERVGGDRHDVRVIDAPGSFELGVLASVAAMDGRFAAVVAIGCIVRGQTRHDRYLAQAIAAGLMQVSVTTGVPTAFGVLTVETPKQARARAGGSKGNKGGEAMNAALHALASLARLRDQAGAGWIDRLGALAPDKARDNEDADHDDSADEPAAPDARARVEE